ncbi:MAG: ROK family protein [Nitriliruptoraceae bacterium]
MPAPIAVGMDIGGTHLRAGIVDENGHVQHFTHVATRHASNAELVTQIGDILATFPPHLPVGIAIAGLVDATGTLQTSPNLPQITYPLPLAQTLTERCQRRVVVGNDASYAATAEHRFGAGQNVSSMLMVTIGTGVGAGIVMDSKLVTGQNGFAGEFGHMRLSALPDVGETGSETVETYLSGTGIAARANRHRDGQELRTEDIVGLANAGDTAALALLHDAGQVLGIALANVVNLLDVAVCVIGGGAGVGLWPFISSAASETLSSYLLGGVNVRQPPPLRLAVLGDTAGVIGAAVTAANQG